MNLRISEIMTNYMKDNNLTQREFSKLVDLDETIISRYINGERVPNINNLFKILKVTGSDISMGDLYEDK